MPKKRRTHSSSFKAKVALESIKGLKTASEIASEQGVHVSQLQKWKKLLLENASSLFEDGRTTARAAEQPDQQLMDQLYQQIGKLQMELEFVKKNLPSSSNDKRMLVDPEHSGLSIRRQCELLSLPRSSYYLTLHTESPENLALMKRVDELHLAHSFWRIRFSGPVS